jgi:hypothetical protein
VAVDREARDGDEKRPGRGETGVLLDSSDLDGAVADQAGAAEAGELCEAHGLRVKRRAGEGE